MVHLALFIYRRARRRCQIDDECNNANAFEENATTNQTKGQPPTTSHTILYQLFVSSLPAVQS